MADDLDLSFDDLVEYRRRLQEFCRSQFDGVCAFKRGPSFQVHQDEGDLPSNRAHHLSSSATCHESLIDYSQRPLARSEDTTKNARDFVELALQRPASEWTSDGSAPIYCRCRTLPLVISIVESATEELQQHIGTILKQTNDPERLAIGEASGDDKQNWYPPNAYHTYWTLLVLERFRSRFKEEYEKLHESLESSHSTARLHAEMLLWARKATGFEIGLHAAESSTADSDQLAWGMAIELWFGGGFGADVGKQDFLRLGVKCLFARQNSVGIWRTGRPLFHYERSGNAHCYVFETFTVLLSCALSERPSAGFLRDAFKPYARHLLRLWQYAVSTRIPLDPKGFGWSSGHRSNREDPESWATASTYSYGNCLRRLFGIWTREAAARELPIATERKPETEAVSIIGDRGDTWSRSSDNVAVKLMTIFVNPVLSKRPADSLEPDEERIQKNQARGAILFGPPGTSKTTLARAIAAAIDWDYVELHASHFVADGLGEVQRTADRIFKRLMQLDRTVILFDEIDELVREREAESDAFGRFLTTSMLPKLAELWKRRNVMYFVATNHIDYFDSAIIRAERFDAILHVPPPSFDKKLTRLGNLLKERGVHNPISVDQKSIEKSVENFQTGRIKDSDTGVATKGDGGVAEDQVLAKFLLVRWDQLDELATIIASHVKAEETVDQGLLKKALRQMPDPFLDKTSSFMRYLDSEKYERRDYSKLIVWEVTPCVPNETHAKVRSENGRCWHESFDFDGLPSEFSKIGLGRVRLKD